MKCPSKPYKIKMDRCGKCGEPIPEGHVFCIMCEKENEEEMKRFEVSDM